jgi:hypothetical protein
MLTHFYYNAGPMRGGHLKSGNGGGSVVQPSWMLITAFALDRAGSERGKTPVKIKDYATT